MAEQENTVLPTPTASYTSGNILKCKKVLRLQTEHSVFNVNPSLKEGVQTESQTYLHLQSVFLITLQSVGKCEVAYARPVCWVLRHHVKAGN
jgi:hypothetical protein